MGLTTFPGLELSYSLIVTCLGLVWPHSPVAHPSVASKYSASEGLFQDVLSGLDPHQKGADLMP